MKQNEIFEFRNFDFKRFSVSVTLLYANESNYVNKFASKGVEG